MPERLNLIILGKQGAGKGTQCKRLAARYSIPHVSTGDILRAAIQADSPLGRSVASILDSGALVSDDLVIKLIEDRFIDLDAPTELATQRLSTRRICQECGLIYNESVIEAISCTCSKFGGDVIQRA